MSPGPAAAAPETPFVRFKGLAYRGHDPSWAHAPLSGEGAAAQGGRFNPKGVAALYLSLAVETVFKEVSAGFGHRFDPLTICAYDVECEALVDLTTEDARAAAGVTYEQLAAPWLLLVAAVALTVPAAAGPVLAVAAVLLAVRVAAASVRAESSRSR